MNQKISKKIRKEVNRKVRSDFEELLLTLNNERLLWRIVIAVRIIFKWRLKNITFKTKV